ncbi:MAG: TCR/Tet family transporter [Verrucomicrobiaceae bacterium]|nr:TCR/Tet family transporter [Verrucomicrobiaceae bacterium]
MPARKPAMGFIFITLVLDILGIGLVIPILPKLIEEFQGHDTARAAETYGLLASVYALMQFVFAPMLGSLSDRFGRRPVILFSLLGSGLDYFVLAMAPSLGWFFIGRVVSGITGANFGTATAYIADISPPEKRAANFGMVGAAFGLGFIIGPALGGYLGGINLHLPFYAAGVLTLINWLYGLLVLPESVTDATRGEFSWAKSNPIAALTELMRHPMLLGLASTYFLLALAQQVYPSTWALYGSERYHWNPQATGLSLAVVGLCAAIVQGGLTRRIVPKIGEPNAVMLGVAVSAIAFTGYGLATEGWMVYPLILVGSLGGITIPAVQALISKTVAADEQGAIQGSLTSLQSVAGVVGPLVATGLFRHFITTKPQIPGAAFFFSALMSILAAWIALRSFKGERRRSQG